MAVGFFLIPTALTTNLADSIGDSALDGSKRAHRRGVWSEIGPKSLLLGTDGV